MALNALQIVTIVLVSIATVGGVNWFIQFLANKDIFNIIITQAKRTGGSHTVGFATPGKTALEAARSKRMDASATNAEIQAARWTPRILYGVIGVVSVVALVLVIVQTVKASKLQESMY